MKDKKNSTPYEKVLMARKKDRHGIDYFLQGLFEDFLEMHGDRLFRDDPALTGGIALFEGRPVTVIGHRKGKNTEENIRCNFGMASPEGYRKAVRLMAQAEKFNRPVITFIDTPGAYPGQEAEANGQSNAIAESIAFMSRLKVPSIAIITGEGSSGGALALALSDKVWMLENAVYSILSPEGFATIMWKDALRAGEAASLMKMTAPELRDMGLIDDVLPEGDGCLEVMRRKIKDALSELDQLNHEDRIAARYEKFMAMDGAKRIAGTKSTIDSKRTAGTKSTTDSKRTAGTKNTTGSKSTVGTKIAVGIKRAAGSKRAMEPRITAESKGGQK